MECLFCQIQQGLVPVVGGAIYEDELVYAAHYSHGGLPEYLGHLVVQTRRHARLSLISRTARRVLSACLLRGSRGRSRSASGPNAAMLSFSEKLFLTCMSSLLLVIRIRRRNTGIRISVRGLTLPKAVPKRSLPCVIDCVSF